MNHLTHHADTVFFSLSSPVVSCSKLQMYARYIKNHRLSSPFRVFFSF
jgi:hypothetical protein